METPTSSIEPGDLIAPRMRELLPDSVDVTVAWSITCPGSFDVRLYDADLNWAMDERLDRREFWDMVESDGTGWDAYGIHGFEAMLLTVGMLLDPQYDDKRHRIPEPESGKRLNERGDQWCRYVADKFISSMEEARGEHDDYVSKEACGG